MKSINGFMGSGILVALLTAMIAPVHAAYPTQMEVTIEFWNDTGNDLKLNSATWFPAGTDLSPYGMSADQNSETFKILLANPRNDAASFSVRDGDKSCVFTLSHEKTFSWIGVNPAPDKSATARSVGSTPAECSASVIKGQKSMGSYTARVRMK